MPPLGYVLIIAGAFLARQVMVGRAANTAEDLRDATLAFLNGDMATVKDAFARRGGGTAGVVGPSSVPSYQGGATGSALGIAVMNKAVELGSAAKGYVWGATGPDYYDCSGLIWRACKAVGVYTGPRFTSSSFVSVMAVPHGSPFSSNSQLALCERIDYPIAAGDIILWPGKHIGIATGPDSYYSARSPSKGIGGASITGDAGYFGTSPYIYRIKRKENK